MKGQTWVSGSGLEISHVFAFIALEGWGSAVAVDGRIGWANFFGSPSIISCCKIANIGDLIL